MRLVFYTEDHFDGLKEENSRLSSELRQAKGCIKTLENMRPMWAQGWSSDSMAAQCSASALNEVWKILGVDNQTDAMEKLRGLVK